MDYGTRPWRGGEGKERQEAEAEGWAGASEEERVLREAVEWSLEQGLHGNATWLAERLLAMRGRNQGALALLATCHLRAGRPARAHALLLPYIDPGCSFPPSSSSSSSLSSSTGDCATLSERNRYLFAQAAFLLGHLKEAHDALLPHPTATPPHGPAGSYLLGQVLRHMNQRARAVQYLRHSLEQQPFMWSAYEVLCALGEDVDATLFFQPLTSAPSGAEITSSAAKINPLILEHTLTPSVPMERLAARTPHVVADSPSLVAPRSFLFSDPSPSSTSTPQQTFAAPCLPPMPKRKPDAQRARQVPRRSTRLSFSSATDESGDTASTPKCKPEATPKPRLPKPNHRGIKYADDEQGGLSAFEDVPTMGKLGLPGQNTRGSHAVSAISRPEAEREVYKLFQTMGNAYRHLCQLRCREAIATFKRLPDQHYNTSWVLSQVARAHFEMVNYAEAERLFAAAHRMESARTADMEIYSTILWHLRKEVDLSHLAQQLVDADKLSPQAWCALGNCFSLQKDHQTAIKFFQRATQVDSRFAYAYTLCGHEYVASDDLEKALSCFRSALRIDPRHYNAWFGLGLVYYRQERYEFAEYHFRRALSINPSSSILKCYIGMVLYANSRPQEALEALEEAIRMNPSNGLAKYKKACVLFALGQYAQVIADLLALKESAPKEATLYCLLGKAYKREGNEEAALRCFHAALDMDAKNQPYIKGLIEKLYIPDDPAHDDPLPDLLP